MTLYQNDFSSLNPLQVTRLETDEEISGLTNNVEIDLIPIVADAEKAYVKILNSEYNTVKYNSYPKGSDGLSGHQLKAGHL